MHHRLYVFVAIGFSPMPAASASEPVSVDEAATALKRGAEFFHTQVSIQGGYLWRYASDFSEREGEVPASPTTAWVQPPGTPSVGSAYLTAYELTGDGYYLDAARESALALVHGQLESGGWDYRIVFDTAERKRFAYRADGASRPASTNQNKKRRNTTTLDDNTTQAALSFLMRVDHALKFEHTEIHEAAEYALASLLAAQYPNGAWPQRFDAPPDAERFPVKRASYPDSWSRKYPNKDYRSYYTFNDNTMADMIELMFLAAEIYDEPRYDRAGRRGGDFILLAQMPEPQPGWAQQYDAKMHPAWARKFEPPSVTGAESQRVMETLLRLFELTGDRKYLERLPRALAYFRRSQLDDGRLARFFELKTNRPLYFTKDYRLTYSDADMPTHYGFKSGNRLDEISARFERLTATTESQKHRATAFQKPNRPMMSEKLTAKAQKLVQTQDERGAWVEPAPNRARSKIPTGTPSLGSRTFAANVVALAQYIAASSPNASAL